MIRRLLLSLLLLPLPATAQDVCSFLGTVSVLGTVDICQLQTGITLQSIQVTPANPTVSVPNSITFTATGAFSDGSFSNITTQASWSVVGSGVSNDGPTFTCNQSANVTAVASLSGINGSTPLHCQSVTFTPQGNLTAFQNQPFSQPFTASGGTPPYTFSSSDLPGWLSLSNTGCPAQQINCDLNGTQASPSNFSFHVQATDANNVTACAAPGCPITVTVVAVTGENENYCTIGPLHHEFEGTGVGGTDNGAALPTKCTYDTVAATPATGSIITVCPVGQKSRADGTTAVTCTKNKIQDAVNIANCGNRIYIYPNNYSVSGGKVVATQNVYSESVNIPGTTCGPNDPRPNGSPNQFEWIWVASLDITNPYFPQPGTRITPAWAGQTSLPGRQPFPGPPLCNPVSDLNCEPNGNYLPAIEPTLTTCPNLAQPCPAINGDISAISGWRFIGIEAFMQKQVATNGVPGTAPGWVGQLIDFSCPLDNQGKPNCQNVGWQDVILDRMDLHACQFKDDVGCTDQMPIAVRAQNGNYFAFINSFCYGFKTLGDNAGLQGPTDESKCFLGGNVQTQQDDGPIKVQNDFLEASTERVFFGGAVSNGSLDPADIDINYNHLFLPLNWLVGIPCPFDPTNPGQHIPWCIGFQGGSLYDLWVQSGGDTYDPTHAGCVVDAPPAGGTQATCGVNITGGVVTNAFPVTPGKGYVVANIHPTACRFISGSTCVTAPPLNTSVTNTGSLATGNYLVGVAYQNGSFETDLTTAVVFVSAILNGIGEIDIAAPGNPPGQTFTTYSTYSCSIPSGKKNCTPKLNFSGTPVGSSAAITAVGSGSSHNDASLKAEDGIYIVKNMLELKHGKRVRIEGNVGENSTVGQADQFGRAMEFDPTCQPFTSGHPELCSSNQYTVRDWTLRYNLLRYVAQGIAISQETPVVAQNGPASIHDNVISMNGTYTSKTPTQFQAASGNGIRLNTTTTQTQASNNIKINHNDFIHTEPSSPFGNAALGSGMNVDGICDDVSLGGIVMRGVGNTNNIFAGGLKNTAHTTPNPNKPGSGNTCYSCTNANCGSSRNAADALLQSFREGPVSGGLYQKNIVSGIRITNAGTNCSGTTATISGDGTGATVGLTISGQNVIGAQMNNVGQNYSTATVAFSGGCNATAVAVLSGSGAASPTDVACIDSNLNVIAGFPGEVSLSYQPTMNALITGSDAVQTAQLDHPNSCVKPLGGGNIDVSNWGNVQFVNFLTDVAGAEIPTGDLHLAAGSPGHNAANGDNSGRDVANCANPNDIGACYDLVLKYTGCSLQNGTGGNVTVCPP